MLIIDSNKQTSLDFNMLETKNVHPNDLNYKLIIIAEGIEYGFPASYDSNIKKIRAEIPILDNVILSELDKGTLSAKLEVTGIDKKFYAIPWEETITVRTDAYPEIKMELSESKHTETRVVLDKQEIVQEDHSVVSKIEKQVGEPKDGKSLRSLAEQANSIKVKSIPKVTMKEKETLTESVNVKKRTDNGTEVHENDKTSVEESLSQLNEIKSSIPNIPNWL